MAEEKKPQAGNEPAQEVALQQVNQPSEINPFGSKEGFALAQREATMLSQSSIVPTLFQNRIDNCVIAIEMSHRMGASPLMVMQNLCIVHGNPSFSSKFLIATVNACGKFSPLRYILYDESGNVIDKPNPKQKAFSCVAYAIDKKTGEELYGTLVDLDMAKKEGWSTKQGSKWLTMPELMLKYRAAAFFQRTYAPEIGMGMMTTEEIEDIDAEVISSKRPNGRVSGIGKGIEERLNAMQEQKEQEEAEIAEEVTPNGGTLFEED